MNLTYTGFYNRDTKSDVHFPLLRSYLGFSPGPRHTCLFRNKASFYGEVLSAPCPTSKLEDHALSAVHNCLFYIFVSMPHIGGRSSIRMSGAIPYFCVSLPVVERVSGLKLIIIIIVIIIIICELYTIRIRRKGRRKKIRRWRIQ